MVNNSQNIYMPAVKPRQGELKAINSLSQAQLKKIVPLILTNGDIKNARGQFAKHLTTSNSIDLMIDVGLIFSEESAAIFADSFTKTNSNRSYGFSIPSTAPLEAFNALLTLSQTKEAAIHLRQGKYSSIENIHSLYQVAKNNNTNLSIIIDFEHIEKSSQVQEYERKAEQLLKNDLFSLPWHRIIILSGSFPKSISSVPNSTIPDKESGVVRIPEKNVSSRLELNLWNLIRQNSPLDKTLLYGDYSVFYVSNAEQETTSNHPSAPNIRYAQDAEWIILRGQVGDNKSFYTLAKQLTQLCLVDQPSLSAGDMIYNDRANNPEPTGPGGSSQWLEWSSSHHIAFTIRQLSNHGVI